MVTGRPDFYFRKTQLLPQNIGLEAYFNTKLTLLNRRFTSDLWKLQADNIINHCDQAREILANQIAIVESDPHAVQVFKDIPKGHTLAVSGELLYVFQCQPVTVNITETSTCHQDLPVVFKNETWFVHHKTRVLIKESPTTECTVNVPAGFRVGSAWIAPGPVFTQLKAPPPLPVRGPVISHFAPIRNLGNGGLYRLDDIRALHRIIQFPYERQASQTSMAQMIAGGPPSASWDPNKLFSSFDLHRLAERAKSRPEKFLTEMGASYMIVLGLYALFVVIRFIMALVLNAISLFTIGRPRRDLWRTFFDAFTMV